MGTYNCLMMDINYNLALHIVYISVHAVVLSLDTSSIRRKAGRLSEHCRHKKTIIIR